MPVAPPLYCHVQVAGRSFEVMLEMGGKFKGYVHVFDESKDKSQNRDVVVSGAFWRDGCLWVTDEDIFEHVEGLIDAVERALFQKFAN